jgi:hypothetical protein
MNQIVACLAQATNEVSFAAANLNLDFSIFKFEAPASYKAFGDKLSLARKDKAEYGTPHITARKLGALFNQILPKTPTLITAYGARVSEILPLIDSSSEDITVTSLFGQQLGADGTTIWAAATSGDGAVPVHLLACLLARTWSGPQATSIWAQIVAERKKEIADGYENGTIKDYPTLAAFRQEITRQQLAEWDASARAWVQAADDIKGKDLDSLRLIISDLNLPVESGIDLYKNVTKVWHSSMVTIENLLKGIPQTVYNGATLVGISSWHILPDIISFKPKMKEIKHNDKLVPRGGVLTVGLQYVPRDGDSDDDSSTSNGGNGPLGVFWSLSLAHLKFYGPPVKVSRSLGLNASRVSFDHFLLVALGSLSSCLNMSLIECSTLLIAIWTYLDETASRDPTRCPEQAGQPQSSGSLHGPIDAEVPSTICISAQDKIDASSFIRRRESNWIKLFYEASTTLLESENVDQEIACMLANCGRRRGKAFWSNFDPANRLFGLYNPRTVIPLLKDTQSQINILRLLAQRSKTTTTHESLVLIRYPAAKSWCTDRECCVWEACSAVPVQSASSKRTHDGSQIYTSAFKRFIIVERDLQMNQTIRLNNNRKGYAGSCTCPGECPEMPANEFDFSAMDNACPCKQAKEQCTRVCHFGSIRNCLREPTQTDIFIDRRLEEISALGEYGFVVYQHRSFRNRNQFGPGMQEAEDFYFAESPSRGLRLFDFIAGCPQETCLYGVKLGGVVIAGAQDQSTSSSHLRMSHSAFSRDVPRSQFRVGSSFEQLEFTYDEIVEIFKTHRFSPSKLIEYLDTGTSKYPDPRFERHPPSSLSRNGGQALPEMQTGIYRSLKALACAADVYRLLPSSTIAMSTILIRDLYKAQWVPEWTGSSQLTQESSGRMTRAQTFACLAMFETGTLDLSPLSLGSVMAMASGDSLFISNTLLSDPSTIPKKHEVTRVVGNIGKAGLAMLIAPEYPQSKEAALEDWSHISHAPFKGESFDGFRNTSMHLSFTGYTAPLYSTDDHGVQDIEAYLLETVLSVHNGGDWIGDLNLLKTLELGQFVRVDQFSDCGHDRNYKGIFRYVVCDSWEELLEGTEDTAVARAHQNWQARLALTCIAVQRGYNVFVLPNSVCWQCLHHGLKQYSRGSNGTDGNLLIM